MSSPASELRLRSDGGLYDISFFGASISHSIELSREVNRKLHRPGAQMSEFAEPWAKLSREAKRAYLLEVHEYSHHALMFSTPAGVLLWRLNQVISRDIGFLFKKASEHGLEVPSDRPPRQTFCDEAWIDGLLSRSDIDARERQYLIYIIAGLETVMRLRDIFFGRNSARREIQLTFGELIDILNMACEYIEERCEVKFERNWSTNLPLETKVFPEDKALNVMDIAEAHAIAAELFTYRAFNDMEGFKARRAEAEGGPFGAAVFVGAAATELANSLGISPHQVQVAALIACCANLDVASEPQSEMLLEDELPWWRFTSPKLRTLEWYIESIRNCENLLSTPLITEGSNWLSFYDVKAPPSGANIDDHAEYVSCLMQTLQSFGLDLQLQEIHAGLGLNSRFLLTLLKKTLPDEDFSDLEELPPEDWRAKLLLAVNFIEFENGILFHPVPLDERYSKNHPLRKFDIFERFERADYQFLANVCNGTACRTMRAAYEWHAVPSSELLQRKLEEAFGASNAIAICRLLSIYESSSAQGMYRAHLVVLPLDLEGSTQFLG